MNLDLDLNNNKIIDNQKNFLNSTLGKVIDEGINIGLKAILPNFIENQIIEIKDVLLENGFKDALKQGIDSAIDIGKSAIGIFTGDFENVSQIQTAIKKGGIIDTVSNLLDKAIDFTSEKEILNSAVCDLIKTGKDTILEQVSNNIEENLSNQINSIEKLNKYCRNWNNYFENKNFEGMEKEYNKIRKQTKNIIPIENTIKTTRYIENLHNLIKNNGKNFDVSDEEIELAKKL